MNMYTPKQLDAIFTILVYNDMIPYLVQRAFWADGFDLVQNNISVSTNNKAIYDRLKKVKATLTDLEKDKINKIRDIIFKTPLEKLPLFINDELTKPILSWRLRNQV